MVTIAICQACEKLQGEVGDPDWLCGQCQVDLREAEIRADERAATIAELRATLLGPRGERWLCLTGRNAEVKWIESALQAVASRGKSDDGEDA